MAEVASAASEGDLVVGSAGGASGVGKQSGDASIVGGPSGVASGGGVLGVDTADAMETIDRSVVPSERMLSSRYGSVAGAVGSGGGANPAGTSGQLVFSDRAKTGDNNAGRFDNWPLLLVNRAIRRTVEPSGGVVQGALVVARREHDPYAPWYAGQVGKAKSTSEGPGTIDRDAGTVEQDGPTFNSEQGGDRNDIA